MHQQSSTPQKPHLWLVRVAIEELPGADNNNYALIIVAINQQIAHRVALTRVHEHRKALNKKAYQSVSITSATIEPTKEDRVLFFCHIR